MEGLAEEKERIVHSMLKRGLSIDFIYGIVEMDADEVKLLLNEKALPV